MKLTELEGWALGIAVVVAAGWFVKHHYFDKPAEQAEQLVEAVRRGDMDQVQTLLDDGADVNRPDEEGYYPLYVAVSRQDQPMIQLLLDHGADRSQCAPPRPATGTG
jgi:ankyrin repeat protein